ncbi:hypothetical protein Ahy_A08g037938 [Arachis hypogaea]|uniref:Uncharacterized protein n=1 Tax=Arachis hypogaea TaxID=3818 RepID=A0A445BS71_ARAHY|nr:hypothetical protein Ahy_A08g037938 [Arachis hypogaea]
MFEIREMHDASSVYDMYKMSKIFKVYRGKFVPMGEPSTWPRYNGLKVIANWTLRRATKG